MLRAESHAGIGDAEIDSIAMTRQLYLGLRSSAVLHDVPQGLLRDPNRHRVTSFGICPGTW